MSYENINTSLNLAKFVEFPLVLSFLGFIYAGLDIPNSTHCARSAKVACVVVDFILRVAKSFGQMSQSPVGFVCFALFPDYHYRSSYSCLHAVRRLLLHKWRMRNIDS